MQSTEILIKCITLLYRESQMTGISDSSEDLVINTLAILPKSEVSLLGNDNIGDVLKKIIMDLCVPAEELELDAVSILMPVKLSCQEDMRPYEALKLGLADDVPVGEVKKMIINIKRNLNNYFKEIEISKTLSVANYEFKHKRNTIKSTNTFIGKLITNLEALELQRKHKDPAVLDEVDIGDDTALAGLMEKIKDATTGKGLLRTGWKWLNLMTQGGFRRGELTEILGLQHNYKTGFSLSLFVQIAIYNKPYLFNKQKKPLLLRISFEDELVSNLQFVYTYLKYIETRVNVDTANISNQEMATYVKKQMGITGFHVKMVRVDPTRWTYKNIFTTILELEANGYEVSLLMLDYLGLIPTVGCNNTGGTGSDLRDLFRRVKNFCGEKKITLITPHQMSPDAKKLLRAGVPDHSFVKEIANRGYTSGSSQIDQEIDLELNIHIAKHKGKSFLTIQRGKHRLPTVTPIENLYMVLPFPNGMPILPDVMDEQPISSRTVGGLDEIDLDF